MFFFFPDKMGSKRRSSDIISLLVSIYGSKDIFIDEYRAVLADRLLHQLNYNTARYNFDYILYTQNRQKYKKSSIKVFSSAEKLKRENVLKNAAYGVMFVLSGAFAGRFVTWSC